MSLVSTITRTSRYVGRNLLGILEEIGGGAMLTWRVLLTTPQIFKSWSLTVDQMLEIGNRSMPLVLVVSVFTGAVTAVQASYQFESWIPLVLLSSTVHRSVIIELGPVLTALVVGGRVSASIAAELGTMKVTEQVDALEAMAIDPVRYLVLPRFWAATLMLPLITALANVLAMGGAYAVALLTVDGMTHHIFVEGLKMHFYMSDMAAGLVKALFFGMIIASSGSFYGLRAGGGAEGVGRATMKAVVANCLGILVLDYFLAAVLFQMVLGGAH
jgi:phospholipid/cholesterol/gamma-HCH transport system permease protein